MTSERRATSARMRMAGPRAAGSLEASASSSRDDGRQGSPQLVRDVGAARALARESFEQVPHERIEGRGEERDLGRARRRRALVLEGALAAEAAGPADQRRELGDRRPQGAPYRPPQEQRGDRNERRHRAPDRRHGRAMPDNRDRGDDDRAPVISRGTCTPWASARVVDRGASPRCEPAAASGAPAEYLEPSANHTRQAHALALGGSDHLARGLVARIALGELHGERIACSRRLIARPTLVAGRERPIGHDRRRDAHRKQAG